MAVDSFPDSSEDVLNDLDPLSRALLDLSVQRGMDDAEIAQVLGTDEDSVFEVRVGLLRNLAEKVAREHAEAELPELEAAVTARLYPDVAGAGEPEAADEAAPEAEVEPEADAPDGPEALEAEAGEDVPVEADDLGDEVDEAELDETPVEVEDEAEPEPQERKRRSPLAWLLPLLLIITVVALIIALTSGEDDTASEPTAQEQRQQEPAERPADREERQARPQRLTGLGSGGATGTATIDGRKLTLKLRNLPDPKGGVYTVWLYDSIIDAKRLAEVRGRTATAKLPRNTKGYEFLDVSLEPRDGNANHSGQSVLRAELRKLAN